MVPKSRRNAILAATLLLATTFAPLVATPAAAAVGVRANAGASQVINQGDTALLDGSRSYTLSGGNLSYKWDFNLSDGIQEDATGVLASHQYNDTGIFTVTLTVSDGAQSDADQTTVAVTATNGTVPGVPNLPPVAIPPRNQQGRQNVSMVFDGTRSFDPNGDNLTFEWDFDELDGLTPGGDAQGPVVSWIYWTSGVFNVTMIVSDGNGSDSGRTSAIVLPDNGTVIPGVNIPPVAVAEGDNVGQINEPMEFNGNRSFDADGDTMRFTWDFDDADGRTTDVNAEGTVVWHSYPNTGLYNVTLTVTDPQGQDTDTMRVIVTDEVGGVPGVPGLPPIAIITSPIPGTRHDIGELIHFDGTQSFDVDGDIVAAQWSDTSRGPADAPFSNQLETNYSFSEGGVKIVTLLIEDNDGIVTGNTVEFFVNDSGSGPLNRQPDGEIEGNDTGEEDVPMNFTANMTDPDGDQMNYTWDFNLRDGLQDTGPTGRNVSHAFPDPGDYTIAVSVLDGNHRNVPVIKTFNVQINERPTHPPEAFAGNDTSVQAGNGLVFDCRGTDSDGNITLYEWDFEGDGGFDYRSPDSGFTIFSYARDGNFTAMCRVTDNDGLTATDGRRVDVRPAPNDAPIADAGPDKPNEVQGEQVFLHGTGTDTDGNISLYEWDFEGDGVYDFIDGTTGDTFHVYANSGTYIAVLRVTDNRNARGTDTAAITVRRNQPPTANAGADQAVSAGQQVSFSGAASRDAEGAISKYSWDYDSSDGIQEDFTGVAPVHTYDREGSYLVTLTVYDALGQSATDTMFVDVTQHPDVTISIDSGGTKELAPDQTSSYLLTVTNTGDGTDTISLSIEGEAAIVAWYTLDARQITNLEAGGARVVHLNVAVPREALVDDAQPIIVHATSVADPAKSAQATAFTEVKEVVKIELTFSSFPSTGKPGETVEVVAHLSNTGNREVRVLFAELLGDSAWLVLKEPQVPFAVKARKSQDFKFDLTVPADAPAGMHQITLTAKVSGSSVSDTETVPIEITGGPLLPSLAGPGLMLAIVVAAALVLFPRGPKRGRKSEP